MDSVLESLLTFVLLYKYAAIFCITFLGEMAVPIPAGGILIASAFFATQGYLNFGWVFAAGLAGNVIGDSIGFWLARKYGERVIIKIGFGRLLRSAGFKALEAKLATHPISMVFVSRFILTPVVNVMTGMAKIPYRTFLAVDIIGEIGDVGLLCAFGGIFGSNWQYLEHLLGNVVLIVITLALLIVISLWRRLSRKTAARYIRHAAPLN